jgi:ABC-type glycerol-3-phosphate transport system substrate-binding protein
VNTSRRISRRDFMKVAASLTAAGALAACAAPTAPAPAAPASGGQQADQAAPTAAPASNAKKTLIEMWMWETEDRWKKLEQAAKLNEKFPDVTFKWTALPFDQLHQKALTSMAAGMAEGLPAIVRSYMGYYRTFANTKGLADVTDIVTGYEKDVLPASYKGLVSSGKVYGFPDDTGVTLLGYRWDIFEKAGLPSDPDKVADLLKTYDDMISVGKTIEKATGAKLFNMLPDAGYFTPLTLQDTTGNFDAEGKVIMDSPQHVEVAQQVKRLWDSGLVTNLDQAPQQWQAYKDGKIALMMWPNWTDFVIIDAAPETKGKWRVTKLPALKAGGKRAHTDDGCWLAIPDVHPPEIKKLAAQIAEYMKFTVPAATAHMKTFQGAFVSYVPALQAMENEPSPMLDNQFVYKTFLKAAQDEQILPWYRTSAFFSDAEQAAGEAMFKILKDGAPADATLKATADAIRQKQKDKGTM